MKSSLPVIILILASMLWGLVWWPLKYVHGLGIDGLPLVAVGHAGATLVLMPLLWRQANAWLPMWPWMLGIALVGGAANITFNLAMVYGDVVRAMVLFYLLPVWGVLGGRIFLGERIDGLRLISMLLALLGAYLMLGASLAMLTQFSWMDLTALLSGFLFAMNNIIFRMTSTIPTASKITALFGGGLLLAIVPLGTGMVVTPPLTLIVISAGLAIGIGWWLVATLGSQWAVSRLEAGRAAVIMVMELVTAVLSSALIAGEALADHEWGGVACVLTATLLEAWRPEASGEKQRT